MTIYVPPVVSPAQLAAQALALAPSSALDSGLAAYTLDDLATCISSQGLTSGVTYAVQARVAPGKAGTAVSNLFFSCATAEVGGVAGQNLCGVYTADGQTQLAVTGDLSNAGTAGNWQGTGASRQTPCAFTIPAAATFLWVVALAVFATTAPSLRCAGATIGAGAITVGSLRSGQIAAAQTALPATFSPAGLSSGPALTLGFGLA